MTDTITLRMRIRNLIAFFFRSLLWALNLLLVLYTCLAYWLLHSLTIEHWTAGMVMISLPVAWLLNLVAVGFWLWSRPWRATLSGLCLLVGAVLVGSRTFVWHGPAELPPTGKAIKVFSYNVKSFGLEEDWDETGNSPGVRGIETYVLNYNAPIKCFQEFYNVATTPNYDLIDRFRQAGYSSALLHPELTQSQHGDIGVAIFSRYPILQSGREMFSEINGLVWADVQAGTDTIRVINVHLHSMGIRVGRVLKQNRMREVRHETRGVLSALRLGFIERNKQVLRVEQYIRESPYPVIVTGDHNDTPYSVVYERLRRTLPNSFEEAGRGFGFSYNRLPGFIRIDFQFHDPRLRTIDFETINAVKYSDHYPIAGTYLLK